MPNTNFQTFHQMVNAINNVVKQATGRDNVQNIDMDFVTVAQRKRLVEEIITGNPASFVTNISEPIDHLIVQIDAAQSGSGDPSPENVRPISGWTGADVTRTGKNLIDDTKKAKVGTKSIYFGTDSDRGVSCVLPAGTYIVSVQMADNGTTNIYAYDTSNNENLTGFPAYDVKYETFTLSKRTSIRFRVYNNNGFTSADDLTHAWINIGSTATEYEPFGNTYAVSFPAGAGTVYGGTLTVNKDGTGTLLVDRANIASYNGETLPSTWISDRDVYAQGTTPTTGAQVVYKLATPVTYQLTNQQVIETLNGVNNIWADTGNVTVLYKNYEEAI